MSARTIGIACLATSHAAGIPGCASHGRAGRAVDELKK
jgi:hypothetical protein